MIANHSSDVCLEMQTQLIDLGVLKENIIFFNDENFIKRSYESRYDFFKTYSKFAGEEGIVGNVAECGVHRGVTASFLNMLYPDKKLYLFDTFEGFTQQDLDVERRMGNKNFIDSAYDRLGGFQTSIDLVLSKMVYPENIVIKQGWVPETFKGVEDVFCFVNLDMDLYIPMLAAMKYFWNKMSNNGVILSHDHDNPHYNVKQAVLDFETHLNRKIPKLPIHPRVGLALIKD